MYIYMFSFTISPARVPEKSAAFFFILFHISILGC